MSYTIAVAGKGGVGKTTLSGLIARYLIKSGKGPVFAVDADPNANLNQVLGVDVEHTVGSIREDVLSNIDKIPSGMPKEAFIDMRLQETIIESKDFDLMVMGRPEGPGCYCYANNLLRKNIDRLSDNYKFVLIDNEAGMEHLSRRTTRDIDLLIIVSDAAPVGIMTAGRINNLVDELKLKVHSRKLVIGRSGGDLAALDNYIDDSGLEFAGVVPVDDNVLKYAFGEKPLLDLPENSPAVLAVNEILDKILI